MKASFLLLSAALLLPATGVFAQSSFAAATPGQAGGSVSPTPLAPAGTRYYTRPVAGGGSITYFGAVSSHDACHEQFGQLRQAFETARPTLVFYEKPDLGIDSTETATIGRAGESGYARYLAQQHQVPTERLDNPVAEYEYLQTRIDPERLKLYCLLRATQQFRAHASASNALTKQVMQGLLTTSAGFIPGTEHVIRNMAELQTAYQKYCPNGGSWWLTPAAWFNPGSAAASSNAFLKDVNAAISDYRERFVYGRLLEKAQAGERVLVVLAPDHMPAPAPSVATNYRPAGR